MRAWIGLLGASLVALAASRAAAAPTCLSVAKFNEEATAKGFTARAGTLTFKVKGIDPNAGKGALASLVDVRSKAATGDPCVGTYFKVYGPGPDLGKVKDELFNICCKACDTCTTERGGALGCETWAGEARSSVIFTAPTQTCDIEIRFGGTPNKHSYAVTCDNGAGDSGVGDNLYALEVNRVSLLEGYGGVGKIVGATVLSEQFCFEAASTTPPVDAGPGTDSGATSLTTTLTAVEDVTASSVSPTTVYPDVNDLSCGDDSELFLKFTIPATVGAVKKATLQLTNAGTTSAEGDGGALFRVDSNAWSETTLTWSSRPARGARLGRVGPVSLLQKVTLDVSTAITGPGTYSFVMGAEPADRNGTHFASKETSNPPVLTLEFLPPTAPVPTADAGVPPASDAGCVACDGPKSDEPAPPPSDFSGSCQLSPRSNGAPALLMLGLVLAASAQQRRRRSRAR